MYTPTLRELNADLGVANDVLPQDSQADRPEKMLVYPSPNRVDEKEDQKEKKRKMEKCLLLMVFIFAPIRGTIACGAALAIGILILIVVSEGATYAR